MRVADLLAAEALDLAGALVGATDQSAVGQEIAGLGKSTYAINLVEQDQTEERPDAGNGAQETERDRIVHLGTLQQVAFELGDLCIVSVDQVQIGADHQARARIGEALGNLSAAVGGVAQLLGKGRQVELAVGVDDVGDELRALPDEEAAAAQQVARLPLGARVDVSERE